MVNWHMAFPVARSRGINIPDAGRAWPPSARQGSRRWASKAPKMHCEKCPHVRGSRWLRVGHIGHWTLDTGHSIGLTKLPPFASSLVHQEQHNPTIATKFNYNCHRERCKMPAFFGMCLGSGRIWVTWKPENW
ncbi:uncharacterized protein LOC122624510 isoform X3 [Drosophila teissieri]|uniref:uncharacterized protein LOC122624510 isoform X3 n=1 Tax=Drosophila teissieri TaxID=7243 RepID=UPI001CB9F2DB|nr:uncharacterized protein LOC122624510 isoform X3 [Drosophila teissieri]